MYFENGKHYLVEMVVILGSGEEPNGEGDSGGQTT